ncbi:MAG: hypothetical protein JJ879_04590 [Sneathiella sp.]|nr:hypothetical protein [Sneathiella sp.]
MKSLLGISTFIIGLACSSLASGQEQNWLPPGSDTRPSKPIPEWVLGGELKGDALIGRLLFHSPSLLGERAVRLRLSCASCHPSGHRNDRFFIPNVSPRPGFVDLTHQFWFKAGEDGIENPKRIPSLHNSRSKKRFGTGPHFKSLEDFTRHVIIDEFGGPAPGSRILTFLSSYMKKLTRPNSDGAAPLPRPIPYINYVDLFGHLPEARSFVASLLLEEAGRRYRHEETPTYKEVAKELVRLRSGALTEANHQTALESLKKLSKQIP